MKSGRPATGSIEWVDAAKTVPRGVRVTQANGRRKLLRFDPGTTRDEAIALAPILAERARTAVDDRISLTVAEYVSGWCEWRRSRGLGCVQSDLVILSKHVLPHLGAIPMVAVTRDDLKRLVMALDAKASCGFSIDAAGARKPFGWKSAVNAWSVVRALFRDAQAAKRVDLCIRDDNPAEGITGPDTGTKKAKAYLWPSEFAALVGCRGVPVRWRRLFALAVYTYARAGELAALTWGDIDLDHGVVHIHRAIDRVRGREVKGTKTDTARRMPIESALTPLLRALRAESNGKGPVFDVPCVGVLSAKLRVYLRRAEVDRADLFASDATRKAMTFHDLRATGITWCAVRGDDPLKIMQRAGHADFETTKGYLREAENLAAGFGRVFPPLPEDLLTPPKTRRGVSASVSAFGVAHFIAAAKNKAFPVELTGIELPSGNFEKPKPNADLTFNLSESLRIVRPVAYHPVPSLPLPGCTVTAT